MLKDYSIDIATTPIYWDNTSVINLSNNPMLQSRAKHIMVKHHFIGDHMVKLDVYHEHADIKDQLVNIFAKPLHIDHLIHIKQRLGIIDVKYAYWKFCIILFLNQCFILYFFLDDDEMHDIILNDSFWSMSDQNFDDYEFSCLPTQTNFDKLCLHYNVDQIMALVNLIDLLNWSNYICQYHKWSQKDYVNA